MTCGLSSRPRRDRIPKRSTCSLSDTGRRPRSRLFEGASERLQTTASGGSFNGRERLGTFTVQRERPVGVPSMGSLIPGRHFNGGSRSIGASC
jgi:hypothetical protein